MLNIRGYIYHVSCKELKSESSGPVDLRVGSDTTLKQVTSERLSHILIVKLKPKALLVPVCIYIHAFTGLRVFLFLKDIAGNGPPITVQLVLQKCKETSLKWTAARKRYKPASTYWCLVGNGWEWGLRGSLLIVSQWIIPSFPAFSTNKSMQSSATWGIAWRCDITETMNLLTSTRRI